MKITGKTIVHEENQPNVVFKSGFSDTTQITLDSTGIGFFTATPVGVQSTTATTGTFTAGSGTAAVSGSSWVGNSGTTSYSVSDVISCLKKYGLLAA